MEQILIKRAKKIILENRYLTIGTTNFETVWVSPLAYSLETSPLSFIYYSAIDSLHSKYIEVNRYISGAIFNSAALSDDVDGLQFYAQVEQIPEHQLTKVMNEYFIQSFPDEEIRKKWQRPIADFMGESVQRFYRIVPTQLFLIDMESIKIDKRVEVVIADIQF
ncbi:hypothetical protein [Mucilaginibacter psychrotolerans]|uniref:Pyridoxamine 5'-phosphate oxidase family protein n=1 Tax=Mucilaginibacter psychrotolerans TaxID=1524096 RepID=A0A4Y8SC33_9SPHI|nr:hypothetical protein [Mucilaginibacter psychrotolerans]TFF36201.1 hypothetical protein E2R66_16810 [Mucilaginibacter psychrotolerans]